MTVAQQPAKDEQVHRDLLGQEFTPPDYTMKQIRDAIPAHCYKSSTVRSLGYAVRDIVLSGTLIYAATYISLIPYAPLRGLAWVAYTFCQGCVMTGMWILAHEAGHGAFSQYRQVNNAVGLLFHSLTLNPYHSWRLSHSKHHKATGNMERDMVFLPHTRDSWVQKRHGDTKEAIAQKAAHTGISLAEVVEETPLATLYMMIVQQLFGFPAYLFKNVTGQKYFDAQGKEIRGKKISHFYPGPDHKFFDAKDFWAVVVSDLGLLAVAAGVWWGVQTLGAFYTIVGYIVPWLWVNHWIVALTFLQHTDATLPHYSNEAWNFARGAAATIDRDFGFIGRHLFHGIIETHVLHHYVSTIPFYHADEATEAIKKVMGKHYRFDGTNFLVALWRTARSCHFVEESVEGSGVYMFRNYNDEAKAAREARLADKPEPSRRRASVVVSRERRGSLLGRDSTAVASGFAKAARGLASVEVL